ncbi:unnamed protein product [Caenorhabditis brenneri]
MFSPKKNVDSNTKELMRVIKTSSQLSLTAFKHAFPILGVNYFGSAPDAKLENIEITVEPEGIRMEVNNVYQSASVTYKPLSGGCMQYANGKTEYQADSRFTTIASRDFEMIHRHQMDPLENFSLAFTSSKDISFLSNIREYSFYSNRHFMARKFSMTTIDLYYIEMMLPYFAPDVLKSIHISYHAGRESELKTWDFNNLAKLLQWRRAQHLVIEGVFVKLDVYNYLHFKSVCLTVETISADEVMTIRSDTVRNRHFEKIIIKFQKFENKDLLLDTLGPSFQKKSSPFGETQVYYFNKVKRNHAVVVTLCDNYSIKFQKIDVNDAPAKLLMKTKW